MKRIFAVLFLGLFFISCSNDDSTIYEVAEAEVFDVAGKYDYNTRVQKALINEFYSNCGAFVTGTIEADASGGLNDIILRFSANAAYPQTSRTRNTYNMILYIQPLADCEDFKSEFGTAKTITSSSFTNLSEVPVIEVHQDDIDFNCYKWKVILDIQEKGVPYCISSSEWYDAPLF